MGEDIQTEDAPVEQVSEKTTLTFGQGTEDTQTASEDGQVEQSVSNWNEDKRFKEHWGEDPNKMYESLRFHEKKQGEYDKQLNEYKEQVESLNKYKDDYTSLEKLFDHPEIGNELLGVINKYQQPQQSTQQGQPQQQDQMYAQLQNQVNDFGKWKEQLTQQALQQYNQQQEQQQLNDIDQFAQQYGINYDREDFLKAAKAKNLEPQNWGDYFKAQAVDVAMKSAANRAAESALTNKSSIPGTLPNSSKSSGSDSGLSTRQLLERALG